MVTRVLCVRRGGLGDTVLMVPVLRALRTAVGPARLELAGAAEHAGVLEHFGVVDRVFSSELLAGLRDYYDWVVSDGSGGRGAGRNAPRHTAFDPVLGPDDERPASLQLLARIGLPAPAGGLAAATAFGPGWQPAVGAAVCLHAGSGGRHKCWPVEHYAALAAALAADGVPVVALEGPVERERGVALCAEDRVAPEGVVALAQLLLGARAFVGNDAGPTHLAAALGVPTVAIFGPTDPRVWAPPGARVVHSPTAGGPPDATVAEVLRTVRAVLADTSPGCGPTRA